MISEVIIKVAVTMFCECNWWHFPGCENTISVQPDVYLGENPHDDGIVPILTL